MASPELTLFGVPSLLAGHEAVVFTTDRPYQLLAHLACARRWVRRDELADVLYPEHDAAQARSNLRKVVLLADRVPGVEIERQGDLLRWSPPSDLIRFESAIESRRLDEAIALGARPLLEGFETAYSGAGAAWLLAERQRVTGLWQSAAVQRLAELAARPADSARLARRMLERDPLDESAVTSLVRAHLDLGEQDAATAVVADYERRLADELGLEPTGAVRELAQRARGTLPTAGSVVAPARAGGDFIGRRSELRRIGDLLRRPGWSRR